MLRGLRFCGGGSHTGGQCTAAEAAAVEQLAACHQQLLLDGGFADVRSEAGYAACAQLLSAIDSCARVLNLDVAPRGYRANFSANYRALFPDSARHYRVDVLEASVDQHSAIWVNGDKFELSGEAISHAEALQQAWADLGSILDKRLAYRAGAADSASPMRAEFASTLVSLDVVWAQFECKYISELIAIEEQARQLIVRAVNLEGQLRPLRGLQLQETEKQLVRCIAHLNSVANFKRKGRDDLSVDILEGAREVLARCEPGRPDSFQGAAREAALVLASDVTASYDAMRAYLAEVGTCIERIDPHLCNNAGLVARLVDWEESWEVGARYVRQSALLDAVCDLVAQVRHAQGLAPQLTTMVEDCDVELFLVLPRVVLLCFAADPASKRAELVKSLLAHRFLPAEAQTVALGTSSAPSQGMDAELGALALQVAEVMKAVEANRPWSVARVAARDDRFVSASKGQDAAWELLVRRAVLGGAAEQDLYAGFPATIPKLVEDLMREVEKWSLELQRHCPEDWNQFSAVLVQCLAGPTPRPVETKFLV